MWTCGWEKNKLQFISSSDWFTAFFYIRVSIIIFGVCLEAVLMKQSKNQLWQHKNFWEKFASIILLHIQAQWWYSVSRCMTIRWSNVPAAVTAGHWISLWCDLPEQDLNRYLLPLFFIPSVLSLTSHLPLSPLSVSLCSFSCLSFTLCLAIALPLPSKGPECDRNSNNGAQLCTNWLLLSLTHTHTQSCWFRLFSRTWLTVL